VDQAQRGAVWWPEEPAKPTSRTATNNTDLLSEHRAAEELTRLDRRPNALAGLPGSWLVTSACEETTVYRDPLPLSKELCGGNAREVRFYSALGKWGSRRAHECRKFDHGCERQTNHTEGHPSRPHFAAVITVFFVT
jgi:hypothetical protein